MERLAPNTAALDTPSVEGEAMELFSVVCIIRPETDSPAPAMTAARTRGIRIFQMIRTAAGSPDFVSALRQSPRDIWDEPMNRHTSAIRITAAASAIITPRFFLTFISIRFLFYP